VKARPFVAADAPGVAALQARVYPGSWSSTAAYEAYLRELLLANPWLDAEIPSWVTEDAGRIVGFLGVMPRRMRLNGRALRAAVSCQLMVDPGSRGSFAAVDLLRRLFAGPQDLTIADGANDASRALWEASGGIASPLHSLHWVRLLRPAQGLLSLAGKRMRRLQAVARPLAAALDACLALGRRQPEALDACEAPLDAAALHEAMKQVRAALRPDYEPASLQWLLSQAAAKRRHGELQGALVRDASGRTAGWFLYYLNGSISQVLQLGARPGAHGAVLEHLARHARGRGARALEGRMEPHLTVVLRGKRCIMQNRPVWTLLQARDPALLVPLLRGDAFFSRLDGEWWMRFSGDAPASVSSRLSKGRRDDRETALPAGGAGAGDGPGAGLPRQEPPLLAGLPRGR
jgi:hypothetical protein